MLFGRTIPFDPASPFVTSGVRIGTPAATSRGFDQAAMVEIADIIALVLKNKDDAAKQDEARASYRAVIDSFPKSFAVTEAKVRLAELTDRKM